MCGLFFKTIKLKYAQLKHSEQALFQKVAAILREDCAFWVSTADEGLKAMKGNVMHFRDPDTEDVQKVGFYINFSMNALY